MSESGFLPILYRVGLSLLPVLIFLYALKLVDTYKLLTLRKVLQTVIAGIVVALAAWVVNTIVFQTPWMGAGIWARSGAPMIEEILKSLYVAWLIRNHRVGFMVDSAICGFAVGAGFALIENLTYLPGLETKTLIPFAIRGMGTAMMHGGTTAVFGTLGAFLAETRQSTSFKLFIPGLVAAIVIHTLYNQPYGSAVLPAVVVLAVLPALLSLIFWLSEKSLENWLGNKLDRDIDLLRMLSTGEFSQSHAGQYFRVLQTTYAPELLGDMLCYLQLSLELSAKVKGDLMRREMGFPVDPDPDLPEQLKELQYLENSIGKTGKLAIGPLLGVSSRDIWELQKLAAN